MISSSRGALFVLAATVGAAGALGAQGTLSTQGFGYPTGQLSARTLGAGGALADIDPFSATNPASLVYFGGSVLYVQAEPEYRTITAAGNTEHATIARFPLLTAGLPVTESVTLGLTASNLLDRSFSTSTAGTQRLRDTTLATTNVFSSDGAIGDLRLAVAYAPAAWLRLGVGAHAITGDNRLNSTQRFSDSTRFAPLVDTTTLSYTGNALSAGIELQAPRWASVAASYRRGGTLSLKHGDTTLGRPAHVPDRLSLTAAFLGLRGSAIGVRTARETWTNMAPLGSSSLRVRDTWDTSIGADVLGPRFGDRGVQIRGGVRWRSLPFAAAGQDVDERSVSLGAGTTFARGRAAIDVTGIRATREAALGVRESAFTLSVGVAVRP